MGAFFVELCVAITASILFYYIRDGHVETENLFLQWQHSFVQDIQVARPSLIHENLPLSNRLPFDVSTVSGYIYTVIGQEIMPLTYFSTTIPIESLFLSMGLFLGALHNALRISAEGN